MEPDAFADLGHASSIGGLSLYSNYKYLYRWAFASFSVKSLGMRINCGIHKLSPIDLFTFFALSSIASCVIFYAQLNRLSNVACGGYDRFIPILSTAEEKRDLAFYKTSLSQKLVRVETRS